MIAVNRRARADYDVLEMFEAGVSLSGAEIKSVRGRNVSLAEAYALVKGGQLWLLNCRIAPYAAAGHYGASADPSRDRKLLLHKKEIRHLGLEAARQRLTIVPLKMYLKGHHVKVELGLSRGRRKYEKREVIEKREAQREMGRALKSGR